MWTCVRSAILVSLLIVLSNLGSIPPADGATLPAASSQMARTDPVRVVVDFLTAWRSDPKGEAAVAYLSKPARAHIRSANPLPGIVGVPSAPQSFSVSGAVVNSATATVTAALDGADGQVSRIFTLVLEDYGWAIDTVSSPRQASGTPTSASPMQQPARGMPETGGGGATFLPWILVLGWISAGILVYTSRRHRGTTR